MRLGVRIAVVTRLIPILFEFSKDNFKELRLGHANLGKSRPKVFVEGWGSGSAVEWSLTPTRFSTFLLSIELH